VLGPDGQRLAKRHGAVTLADLRARGVGAPALLRAMAASLVDPDCTARAEPVGTVADLVTEFDPARLSHRPWRFDPDAFSAAVTSGQRTAHM
jgi:glutamyl-tRNA synthetase